MNPIELSLFASRLNAVCDEMGAQLRRAAFSPNIRDRLDYSCAVFDAEGELCAQAAHIPVHLGSMAFAMRSIVQQHQWQAGDVLILNDPYQGGTHLPDITVIAPLLFEQQLVGFVANRAHHADIGAESPGSMPVSSCLSEEGLVIPPTFLSRAGEWQGQVWDTLLAALRNADAAAGDFRAQISANQRGLQRLLELIEALSLSGFQSGLLALNDYAERLAGSMVSSLPAGEYSFRDFMDDDGQGTTDIPIEVVIRRQAGESQLEVDFTGTAEQVSGNINCPLSVTAAAVFYVFRCLMPEQTPACAGAFRPINIKAVAGTLVNAVAPAAVAAGNVETSTRIADVVMGALAIAWPERIPAASGGSMNNIALGSPGSSAGEGQAAWDYYETMGNGAGASADGDGRSAIQTHMTNTLNTPIEVLEMTYPLRVSEYSVRRGSGGTGARQGGHGISREIEFLAPAHGTVLTERRRYAPWGLLQGGPGQSGRNLLNGDALPSKAEFIAKPGDCLRLETPGGGGYGREPSE